jgi:glycosyltransferase involved in cell wall biosynthesis
MDQPVISVVMPMRNASRFLNESIASIRTQSFANLEFLILDDASTDDSLVIAGLHARVDPRIRILPLSPSGVAGALNQGISAARGRFIARMDADDVALPDRLAQQLAAMEADPSLAALGSNVATIDVGGTITGRSDVPPTDLRAALLRENCMVHSSVMLRRAELLAAGGYRTQFRLCEDYDLWLRLSEQYELRNLPDILMHYRHHDGQTSGTAPEHRALGVLAAQYAATARRAGHADPTSDLPTLDRYSLRRIGIAETAICAALGEPMPRRAGPVRRLLRPVARRLLHPLRERDALAPGEWYQRAEELAPWRRDNIFVIIPSYRDRECQWTIRDLFSKARHPDRVTVGVVWQYDPAVDADCFEFETRPEQVRSLMFSHLQSRGCSWARQQALRLWRGEEYALQIDSHMRFVPEWDVTMLAQLRACGSPRAVLTTRPLEYDPPDTLGEQIFCGLSAGDFDQDGILHVAGYGLPFAEAPPRPTPTAFAAGGFIFGPARRLVDVPYDPHIYFIGEEINLAVRLWTAGWDLFVPNEPLVYHYYAKPGQRNLPWFDDPIAARLHKVSIARMHHMLGGKQTRDRRALRDLDRYGLGRARSLAAYESYAGVNFRERTVSEQAKRGEVAVGAAVAA